MLPWLLPYSNTALKLGRNSTELYYCLMKRLLRRNRIASVNMYKVDLPLDQSEEKAVETRRSAEAARKARILNPRLRVIGIDVDALNKQVQEKKHQQNTERQHDKALDMLRQHQDEALYYLEIDKKEQRAAVHKGLTQYWATQQRVEDSRDADLSLDLKGAFKTKIPPGELGPASMQIFQGEGIGLEQMKKEQMKNTNKDLQEQIGDNERRHMGDKHKEMLLNKVLVQKDLNQVQQAKMEEECRKAARIALNNYNQALAAEQAANHKEQRRTEERKNLAEMWHTMTSDMMTECAEAAERDVGGGRPTHILPDRWKGMSPEQLSAIRRERERQRLDRQRQIDAEKIKNTAWDFQLLKVSREAEEDERRAAELRKQQRIETDQFNRQLAREQQTHQEYLNKKLYTNKPTKEYFNQFNSSSR